MGEDVAAHTDLRGRTALVTGAARRLGRSIATALAREGVNIVIHYSRSLEEAGALRSELSGLGVKSWQVRADFEREEEYGTLIARSLEAAGTLDILINNASLFLPGTLADIDFDGLLRHVKINAWVPFALSRDFARLTGRGKIINLLDAKISGYDRAHVAYTLSKRMLSALSEMAALEFAPGVVVNSVAPGPVLPPEGKGQEYLDRLASSVPLGRHGEAEDVAGAVIYLLKSDFLTGQVIYADGGGHLLRQWKTAS